ncbi:MFS transporter [Portibacter lacus]|uniref:MFS transporter n=2 Tax=Portibacter lacus TaxID=1099794 RepID=A0AA37WIN7_9BACT|nr:MFS transporter [Portibacter lacus]
MIAFNLRPALASVGPLIEDIRSDTGLSNFMLGLLTTLPLIGFGIVSILAPLFTKRFGTGLTLFGALILLALGIVIRSISFLPFLYLGTLFFGIAIAFGNVLLPSLTKRNFSANSGFITSLYSSTMAIGASLAAGLSVPLAYNYNFGWSTSLALWVIPVIVAIIIWIPQLWRLKKTSSNRNFLEGIKNMTSSRLAWKVALFMGFQSFTFYVILAWLPSILQGRGYNAEFSGWMLSLCQATGILGSLIIPNIAGKMNDQRVVVAMLIFMEIIGVLGLIFPILGPVYIWISLIGFVLGGSFGLALLFIVVRSSDTESATELSGMAQSIGYLIAATGPILFGSLFDLSGNWNLSLYLLLALSIMKLYVGLGAGKSGVVS